MPSVGSITKTIRIRAVDLPYVEKAMVEHNLTWSGAIHYLIQKSVNTECKHLWKSVNTEKEK